MLPRVPDLIILRAQISHRKESKGHGFAMAPRGFADFALPPSLIPALATAEAPLPDRMRLWPPGQSSAPVACVVDRPPGGARLDDIERIKAASKHVNKQRAPGAKPHSIHTQLMQWSVPQQPGGVTGRGHESTSHAHGSHTSQRGRHPRPGLERGVGTLRGDAVESSLR
jgi:hypothetical protein